MSIENEFEVVGSSAKSAGSMSIEVNQNQPNAAEEEKKEEALSPNFELI